MKKILLFDWGNTIMADFGLPGPMYAWEKVAWIPGAKQALKELAGYTCCIVTNAGESDGDAVAKGLARVGADRYFKRIFTSRDLGFEKPDPGFFSAILTAMRAEACDFILTGDNYEKDIEGAKRAGMKTVFFNRTNREGSFPMADAVIAGMDELPSIIEKL